MATVIVQPPDVSVADLFCQDEAYEQERAATSQLIVFTRALRVRLLCGGDGRAEQEMAGANRDYEDLAALLHHPDEVAVRGAV